MPGGTDTPMPGGMGAAASSRSYGPLGLLVFVRRLRENELLVYGPDAFARPFGSRRLLFQRYALINHPDFIQHVLLTNQENYPKGRLHRQILRPVLGNGLLTSEGEFWRRQRRIAAPAFQHGRLRCMAELMAEAAETLAARWAERDGAIIDLQQEMMALTMDIVAKALFSRDIAGSAPELGAAITTLIESFGRPSLLDLLGLPERLPRRRDPRAMAALDLVDRAIHEMIQARRGGATRNDLLTMLLEARDEKTGEGMSDRQLRDEALTLFAAGHETTALALTWTWYLLSQHPEAEAALHRELDAVLQGRTPRFEDLEDLSYTRMVFEEAMRLYPPAYSLNRTAASDDRIGPHEIAAGTLVTISPWVTHRNPRLWPEPERFDPERFRPDQARERHRFAYLPFGGGPRICVGSGFALMEGRLLLATLASRFRLTLVPGHPVEPLGRVTLRPRHGMRMVVQRRV